jgi:hypothetical protein
LPVFNCTGFGCLTGDWEAYLDFFAEAVIVSATQALDTIKQLIDLANEDRHKISGLSQPAASTLRVHIVLMGQNRSLRLSGW